MRVLEAMSRRLHAVKFRISELIKSSRFRISSNREAMSRHLHAVKFRISELIKSSRFRISSNRSEQTMNASKSAERPGDSTWPFRCNICGTHNELPRELVVREGGNCRKCRATSRFRSIAYALSSHLFSEQKPNPTSPSAASAAATRCAMPPSLSAFLIIRTRSFIAGRFWIFAM